MILWPRLVWQGHQPVCPVSVECEVCAAARKELSIQVRRPAHEVVWDARRPLIVRR